MGSLSALSVVRDRMARCADQLRAWRAVLHYEPCCPRATKRTLAAAAVTAAATAVLLLAALLVWRRPAAEPGGIISLSIQKLAEKAKSPLCQPRLSQGPLCTPWQPLAVTEQI